MTYNQLDKEIVFNHFYRLRHDIKRTYIQSEEVAREFDLSVRVSESWLSKIHPVYAMIFSFVSHPIIVSDLIKEISYFLDITEVEATSLIIPFISNPEPIYSEYGDVKSIFPENIVIEASKSFTKERSYIPQQFSYDNIDFTQERIYSGPLGIVFMVNNLCATDCIYCYADKAHKCELLPFDTLVNVIKDAHDMGVLNIGITGGEFFLYKHWRKLLDTLLEYDYHPGLISTKIPLTEAMVKEIKDYKLTIQISLDSLDDSTLTTVLNVPDGYSAKIQNTIEFLDKYDVAFQVATVITSYNKFIANLESLHCFLNQFKGIRRWEIRVAFRSLYSRDDFDTINVDRDSISKINNWINNIKQTSKIFISWDVSGLDKYFKSKTGGKDFIGSRCSANYSNMVILPDGKVTICEQLYWTSDFITGDLTKQTIGEVWNSSRAMKIAFPKRDDIRTKSACKTCDIFDECYAYCNKCILDVIKGYGIENSDYPDPRCVKAPPFINELGPHEL